MCLVSDEHYDTINRHSSSSSSSSKRAGRCRDAGKDEIYGWCRVDDAGLVVFQYLPLTQARRSALLTPQRMSLPHLLPLTNFQHFTSLRPSNVHLLILYYILQNVRFTLKVKQSNDVRAVTIL